MNEPDNILRLMHSACERWTKQALGYHLAGRAHAVLGIHTHVPTADATILRGGIPWRVAGVIC